MKQFPPRLPVFPPTRYLLRLSWCVERLEAIILSCNFFRINWKRSVTFICSYSSLIYSQVPHEIPTRKNFGHTKYPREKTPDLWNTYEKEFWTDEIPTRKNFAPTKYHEKKIWTHEIPTRKILDPQNSREKKNLDPRTHDDAMAWNQRDPRWHEAHGIYHIRFGLDSETFD